MIDQNELKMGIEIEKEHTQDVALARKIALDHLVGTKEHPGDPRYYSKLKKSGLDECGEIDVVAPVGALTPITPVAPISPSVPPMVAAFTVGVSQPEGQTKLTSSGLGNNGALKPLKSTNLEAPEAKKVGANKIATSKTPPLDGASSITVTPDPMDFFGGQMEAKWE